MNLSLVSQNVSAASEGLLAILRSSPEYGDHFAHITVTLAQWQPAKTEAAILLIDGDAPWQDAGFARGEDETIGLPVLPLLIRKGDKELTVCGPDVRDPVSILSQTASCWMSRSWPSLPAAGCCCASWSPTSRCFPA